MRIKPSGTLGRVMVSALGLTLLVVGGPGTAAVDAKPTPPVTTTGDPIAHDPTMIKAGRYYYVFITGDSGVPNTYLPMKRSRDLLHWEELEPVFATPPAWVVETLGITPTDFWAPDIKYFNGEYHLYYAASQFGINNSVIGLATNVTLDPASPDYRWVDEGLVLRSQPGDDFNAIDADVAFDSAGVAWLSYGSFWAGILMRQLDVATGKLSAANTTTYPLVDRQWAPNAVEAPSIVRHGGYYYLFASFDYCCRGENSEYRTVVGRATEITGPYADHTGLSLLTGGGTELLRSYNEFAGPGGGDVYADRGKTWFVHHYYDTQDNARPKLSIRRLLWRDGWPTLADPLSESSQVGHGGAYFELIEKMAATVVATPPDGPQAPLCGYEGADIQLSTRSGSPCQQWRFESSGDGYFGIRNRHSNKVFDAAFCGYADGTNIGQWGWLDNDCQKFRFLPTANGWTQLQNKNEPGGLPGKVVDAAVPCADGANVQLWTPDAQRCQQFRLQPVGDVLLLSANSGKVLDAAHCGTPGRSTVIQATSDGGGCERWRFVHTSDGYYNVVTAVGGKRLTVKGCDIGGTKVVASKQSTHDPCMDWRLEGLNDGTFRLVGRSNQEVLTVASCGTRDRSGVTREPWTSSDCQRFSLVLP